MIPAMHITAWANVVPWAELGQIEQDLIVSRAIIEIFSDEFCVMSCAIAVVQR